METERKDLVAAEAIDAFVHIGEEVYCCGHGSLAVVVSSRTG